MGTCIKQPITGLEEEPATRVNPVIGTISGFLPKCSPRAQISIDGPKVDTLYAVFVDCNTNILQDDYTEVEMKEKKVSQIPFSEAIKAAKVSLIIQSFSLLSPILPLSIF